MMLKILLFMTLFFVHTHASQLRIINGTQVSENDTKWESIVSLRYYNYHYCGGSLIAPRWVLTAAHCWHDSGGRQFQLTSYDTVAIEDYTLSTQTHYSIEEVIGHPDYNPMTTDNDLTLLKLSLPINSITPMILDRSSTLSAGLESWVAGWGDTDIDPKKEIYPNELIQLSVPIVDYITCNNYYSATGYPLTTNMICAGYMEGNKDSCQGDSGGPLISDSNGQWVQSGIVSWGIGCAEEYYPGVYAKVQNYIPWIESHTGTLPTLSLKNTHFLPAVTNYLLD